MIFMHTYKYIYEDKTFKEVLNRNEMINRKQQN